MMRYFLGMVFASGEHRMVRLLWEMNRSESTISTPFDTLPVENLFRSNGILCDSRAMPFWQEKNEKILIIDWHAIMAVRSPDVHCQFGRPFFCFSAILAGGCHFGGGLTRSKPLHKRECNTQSKKVPARFSSNVTPNSIRCASKFLFV